jgi:tetratricopeptide (TPR) repeat protein
MLSLNLYGEEGIPFAERAVEALQAQQSKGEVLSWSLPNALGTLALAYSGADQFSKAADTYLKAVKNETDKAKKADYYFEIAKNKIWAIDAGPLSESLEKEYLQESQEYLNLLLTMPEASAYLRTKALMLSSDNYSYFLQDYDKAESLIKQALQQSEADQLGDVILAWHTIYLDQKKEEMAAQILLKHYPDQTAIAFYYALANVRAQQKRYSEAHELMQKVLQQLSPDDLIYARYQWLTQAMDLENKYALDASQTALLNDMGVAYWKVNRKSKAEARFLEAIKKAPQEATFHYNLGSLYVENKDWEKAELYLKQAIALNPRHTIRLYNLAGVYIKTKQTAKAQKTLLELKLIDPQYPELSAAFAALK